MIYLMAPLMLLALLFNTSAVASKLVLDLARTTIKVGADFSGDEILIFGVSRDSNGEIVVRVKGPNTTISVHEQGQKFGIWTTIRRVDFKNVPTFYAYAHTPLSWKHLSASTLPRRLETSIENLHYEPVTKLSKSELRKYRNALNTGMENKQMFSDDIRIRRLEKTLFSVRIPVPSTAPKGEYTVDVSLIKDGTLLDQRTVIYMVEHVGLSKSISNISVDHPALYGIFAIVFAIFSGWFANILMRRL